MTPPDHRKGDFRTAQHAGGAVGPDGPDAPSRAADSTPDRDPAAAARSPTALPRRLWLLGAVGMGAAAAGMGWALWQLRAGNPTSAPPPIDVWSLRFEQPGEGELVLADLKGKPLLMNFWATWCPPCITEMPLLDRFYARQRDKGWQVVGIAVDSPTPVREFLARHPVTFPIGLAGLTGIDLGRSLGNASGSLPFSVVFDRQGNVTHTRLGILREADLAGWVRDLG